MDKKKGRLVLTLLEKAKKQLLPPNFDVELVLSQEEFKGLSEVEMKSLRESARKKLEYANKNIAKARLNVGKVQKILTNMAEEKKDGNHMMGAKIPTPVQKLQAYIEQYTDKLDSVDSYEERLVLLKRWNKTEHLSLVHHFSQLNVIPVNFQDLLRALCEIINEDQNLEEQHRIFLCICFLYKKPVELALEPLLYRSMLGYLVEQPAIKSEQVTGFLKAAFYNNVSLVGCGIKSLREFDLKFSGHIDPFYTKLQIQLQLNPRPFLVLPQTCFFLSRPVIAFLKARVEPTAFLPIEYYHYFLQVLVYTFTDNQEHADKYLLTLRKHLKYWESIGNSNYEIFLAKFVQHL